MKKIISMTLAVTMLLGLTACSTKTPTSDVNVSGGESQVNIVYWTPFTGPDGGYMQQIVDKFNQSQTKYKISHEVYTNDTYYDKIKTAVSEGNGPDMAAIHSEQIPTLDNANIISEITDEKFADLGFEEADFVEDPLKAGTYNEKRFSLPLDAHPLVLYYNKDIVDGENIKVPTTYEELISEGKKATKDDVYGFAYSATWPTHMIYRSIMLQNGQEIVDETGTLSNVNNETGILAYNKLRDLTDIHKIAPEVVEQDGPIAMFKAGELAFAIDGIWWITGFKDAGLNFGVAPINTLFGDTHAVWGGSHHIAYINTSILTPEKQEGMDEFIKFLYANLIHWAEGGQIVAYKPVLESEEFKNLEYLPELVKTVETVRLSQNTLVWSDLFKPIEPHLSAALTGQKTIEEALSLVETEGNARAKETLSKSK